MGARPLAEYALLSDCHGAALVHRSGAIEWLCLPRFDSPALCARLLDAEGGHFRVGPVGEFGCDRRYLPDTMVLESRFRTPTGELLLQDALAVGAHDSGHQLGAAAPHALLRELRCVRGPVRVELDYCPRPEYGLIQSQNHLVDGGVLTRGGAAVLRLSTSVALTVDAIGAHAELTLNTGDNLALALEYRSSAETLPAAWSPRRIHRRLQATVRAWESWSAMHRGYEGPWRERVQHSGRVLQALTYKPTGAIVAAPTTSLPETIGGERNWDYRYTWVRDASFTLHALWVAACPDEAYTFFEFMANAALAQLQGGHDMQVVFGVGGEHDLSERQLAHLAGWRGSAPVRVGNAAWEQRQIDVYGELLAAADRLVEQLREHLDPASRHLLAEAADAAAARWHAPDHGIWELRREPQHFLYSKLMCWVALDRAVRLASLLDDGTRVERWRSERERIRAVIETQGFNDRLGAFTMTLGSDQLDASVLMIPLVGFLPADDPRVLTTLDAVEHNLSDSRGLLYRYRTDDGLAGTEGSFLLCTFWLAEARARAGQVERARTLFERAASHANDVGLLAEEVDSASGELLGNFPQAFSHIGLVNAAWAIYQAESLGSG